MKLADYLDQNELTPGELRRLLGVKSRSTVMRYLSGERKPSPGIMDRINELTGGMVTPMDFHDPAPPRCAKIVMGPNGEPRLVLPWTSYQPPNQHANDAHGMPVPLYSVSLRARAARRKMMGSLPDPDAWPSPPLREAMRVLGSRVKVSKRGGFLLDGRLTDTRGVVAAANTWLRANDRPTIPYPGVEPLE
ncbi:MAG: hypothetical protein ACTS3F_05795 [Phycisphaerales bacterium]